MVEVGGGTAGSGCPDSYDYYVVTPVINDIRASIKVETDKLVVTMNNHSSPLLNELESVVSNYSNADSLIDNIMSRYELPISGFVSSVTDIIMQSKATEAAIVKYGALLAGYESLSPEAQAGCNNRLRDQINIIYNNVSGTITDILSANRKVIYDKISDVATRTFSLRLSDFVASYKSAVDSFTINQDNALVSATDYYIANLSVSNVDKFVSDFDPTLRSFIDHWSRVVADEGASLGAKIATVKYSGVGASDKVAAAYTDINSHVAVKSKLLVDRYNEMSAKFSAAVIVFSDATSNARYNTIRDSAMTEVNNRIGSDRLLLSVALSKASSPIYAVGDVVKEFLASTSQTTFIDSSLLSSFKRSTRNSALDLLNSVVANRTAEFSNSIKSIDNNQVSSFTSIMSKFVSDIQAAYVTGASSPQSYVDAFSNFVNMSRGAFGESITDSLNSLMDIVYNKKREITAYIDSVLDSYPVLRLTGDISFPTVINLTGDTNLSFGVANIGGLPWRGWFSLKVVDENNNNYYHNVVPSSPTVVTGHSTQTVVLAIPFARYLAGKTPRSLNITLVTNTYS